MDTILIVILIIITCGILHNKKKKEYEKEVQRHEEFKIAINKSSNRSLLKKLGKNTFIKEFGESAYNKIMNNTDKGFVVEAKLFKEEI